MARPPECCVRVVYSGSENACEVYSSYWPLTPSSLLVALTSNSNTVEPVHRIGLENRESARRTAVESSSLSHPDSQTRNLGYEKKSRFLITGPYAVYVCTYIPLYLAPLEPRNPSQYKFQVICPQNWVSRQQDKRGGQVLGKVRRMIATQERSEDPTGTEVIFHLKIFRSSRHIRCMTKPICRCQRSPCALFGTLTPFTDKVKERSLLAPHGI